MPRAPMRLLPLAALLAGLGACGDDGIKFVPPSANPGQNLMVIDEGFDPTAADYAGKIAAAYTFACAGYTTSGGSGNDGGPLGIDGLSAGDLVAQKQEILAVFATRDTSCHLAQGISRKSDPLASVARYRARWNAALRANVPLSSAFTASEGQQLNAAMTTALSKFQYHGTATAGTAAHENPDVRLVLVERPLGDAAAFASAYTCIAQADLDRFAALYSDPDVVAAYANQPQSTLDADLDRAVAASSVGLVNESYGSTTRLVFDQLQAMAGCPATDFTGYFTAVGGLEQAQRRAAAAAATAPLPLTVQAAGNDGATIDSLADSLDCDPGDPVNLSVGSLALDGTFSSFTNRGACVDVYAPGEDVIVPYAGGWLFAVAGTSFSAPLVARTLSMSAATPYDAAQARQTLLARNAAAGDALAPSTFPSDFFYQPASAAQALTAAPGAPAARWRLPARIDLRQVLGPLVRRRRGLP